MNESDLLRHIADRAPAETLSGGWSLSIGPGDDVAVLKGPGGEPLLVTVDQVVEGVHFVSGTGLGLIARKAVARSVSDIAAMGGEPSWATATGLLPKGFERGEELIDELNRWADRSGCPLIGGDLAFHKAADHPLTLTVTVAGVMEAGHAPVLRSGARAGDRVWLTGPIGGSFEKATGLGRHLTFEPRLEAGRWASEIRPSGRTGASALIDLSDGLGRDAGRVARASGVVIELEAERIPLSPGAAESSGWRRAVADGEDYELLMTIPEGVVVPSGLGLIGPVGVCRALDAGESPTCVIVEAGGTRHDAASLGWDHG